MNKADTVRALANRFLAAPGTRELMAAVEGPMMHIPVRGVWWFLILPVEYVQERPH